MKRPSGTIELRSANCNNKEPGGLEHERERHRKFAAHKVEMLVSCSICTKISSDGDIWSNQKDIGQILRKLCEQKGVEIIEAEACPDHIHMLLSIPPKYSVSQIMGYLKGKSSLMIFDRHANLKYKYGNRHFWARGYFVDTVGRNKEKIREYIQKQLTEDKIADQMSMKEFIDPFTGNKNTKA